MFAIFGLGNIGSEYENTYHNMGFMVLEAFAKKHGLKFSKKKCDAFFTETNLFGQKVMLFMPTTFMNHSGYSVYEAQKKFKLSNQQIVVVYDDVDIPVGEVRLREKGSAGSHNGMKSIVQNLGTTEFPRLRIGIGADYHNLVDYVLSKVRKEHEAQLNDSIQKGVELLEKLIAENGDVNRVH